DIGDHTEGAPLDSRVVGVVPNDHARQRTFDLHKEVGDRTAGLRGERHLLVGARYGKLNDLIVDVLPPTGRDVEEHRGGDHTRRTVEVRCVHGLQLCEGGGHFVVATEAADGDRVVRPRPAQGAQIVPLL